jgi:hypothetical protein
VALALAGALVAGFRADSAEVGAQVMRSDQRDLK